MLQEERIRELLSLLDFKGPMTPKAIAKDLYISLSTIYRDVKEMGERQLVTLDDGLVYKNNLLHMPLSYDMRHDVNLAEKKRLAQIAAGLILPKKTIFFDASSTVEQIVEFIPENAGITVITNGFVTAELLRERRIQTFFLGGGVVEHSGAVTTTIGNDAINSYNYDAFFFSAYGVSDKGYISTSFELEARILRTLFLRKIPGIFLCGENKINKNSFFKFADLTEVDTMICSFQPPDTWPSPKNTIIINNNHVM